MKTLIIVFLIGFFFVEMSYAQMDDKFYYPNKTWAEVKDVNFEEVFLNTDTVKLNAIFLKPEQAPKATVLFFHGAGGNVTSYLFMTKPLVEQGFQVFMIDFRGYGKSTGKPTHINIARDGQLVLEYLLGRKDVQGTKVLLYGASMGTQVAAKLARENQAKVDGLILDGTISSFTDIAADYSPEEQRQMIRQVLTSPYAAKEDVKHIAEVPTLLIHSREDKDVPFHQAEVVYKNAPEPKALLIYEGKHLEALKTDPEMVISKIEEMML